MFVLCLFFSSFFFFPPPTPYDFFVSSMGLLFLVYFFLFIYLCAPPANLGGSFLGGRMLVFVCPYSCLLCLFSDVLNLFMEGLRYI